MERTNGSIEHLVSNVADLTRQVSELRDRVAILYERAHGLGADLDVTAAAVRTVAGEVAELRSEISQELRARPGRGHDLVFVVDRDEAVHRTVAAGLGSAGITVRSFGSVQSVIDHLGVEVPRAALIDLSTTDLPALALAEYLRTSVRTTRVCRLAMTAVVPRAAEARAFHALIEKPLTAEGVLDVVRRSLDRSRQARAARSR
jgi:CheY-like chemotaxis protein